MSRKPVKASITSLLACPFVQKDLLKIFYKPNQKYGCQVIFSRNLKINPTRKHLLKRQVKSAVKNETKSSHQKQYLVLIKNQADSSLKLNKQLIQLINQINKTN